MTAATAPGAVATGLTVLVGLFACALPLWLRAFRWEALRDRHADLAVPFVVTTAVLGLLVVSFPAYRTVVAPDGHALLPPFGLAIISVPWAAFGLRYAGRDHLLAARRVAAGSL